MRAEESPYRVRPVDPDAARELGRVLDLGAAAAQVLLHRGLGDPAEARAFLEPALGGLTRPEGMIDRDLAADRLARAIRSGERVAVFGDYDVDGTTSCAILADALEAMGGDVVAMVAHRFEGGYGFSEQALARCLEARPHVIVTCDCGSSDHPRIQKAMDAGVDVLVIDHHLVPPEPLPALAFLNPHRPDCAFPYKDLCSAGLAFSVAAAVRAALGADLDLRPWLDLVALGTVADVVPLRGDNRRLVRAGLRLLGSPNARPGVVALREVARIPAGTEIGAGEIAFRLAPRLNAAGRLGDPTVTLDLLRARTAEAARAAAGRIESLNDERRAIESRVTEEAMEQALSVYGEAPKAGIVVASERWHRGVVGITAARLVDRFGVPAVVIAVDADGVGHGSGRAPSGYDVYDAFHANADALLKFGGHAAAAGLSLTSARLEAFREGFAACTRSGGGGPSETPWVDVEIGRDFPLPRVRDLRQLEPLGEGNPVPRFGVRASVRSKRTVGEGRHLKLELEVGAARLSAFGPNLGARLGEVGPLLVAYGDLRPDAWRGGEALELHLEGFA